MGSYKVYILPDENSNIIAPPESTAFHGEAELEAKGYICIDAGLGDKYMHAQGNYLDKPYVTDSGIFRYKYIEGVIVEKTPEEIAAEEANLPPPKPSIEADIIAAVIDHEFRLILLELGGF